MVIDTMDNFLVMTYQRCKIYPHRDPSIRPTPFDTNAEYRKENMSRKNQIT